jgi:hypothetical protein
MHFELVFTPYVKLYTFTDSHPVIPNIYTLVVKCSFRFQPLLCQKLHLPCNSFRLCVRAVLLRSCSTYWPICAVVLLAVHLRKLSSHAE